MGTPTSGVPSRATLHNLKENVWNSCSVLLGHPWPCPASQVAPHIHRHRVRGQEALAWLGLPQLALLHRWGRQDHPEQRHPPPYCSETRLGGKTEKEKAMADMMADQAMDFRNGWVRLCYNP